jgi:hypothetical protein
MQQSRKASPQRRLPGSRRTRAADTEVRAQITSDHTYLRRIDMQQDAALDVPKAQTSFSAGQSGSPAHGDCE